MSSFWRNWLTIWGWGVVVFGLALAGAGFAATDGVATAVLGAMGPAPFTFDAPLRFAVGLMGAVTMGWGLTLLAFFRLAETAADQASAWRMALAGVAVWYVIDCAISIATGFTLNAVSNTALLILLLIPILGSRVLSADRSPLAELHAARTAQDRT